jgi:hypothetical protein
MSSYQLFKRTRNIRSAAKQMKPDDAWVKQTRDTLLMQVKNSQPSTPLSQTVLGRSFKIFVPVISFRWMRAPAAIAMAIVVALFSGSLFSVSAAERALPGDFLYSIKLVTEQARIALVKEPEERVKLKTEFTERRVDEMRQVIASPLADKGDRVKQAAEVLKRDMDTIKNQLDEVQETSSPEKAKEAAQMVDEKTAEVIASLQESKAQLSASEKVKVSEAQAAASDTSVKAIELLIDAHAKDANVVSEEDVLKALKTHNEKVAKTVSDSTGLKVEVTSSTQPIEIESTSSTEAIEESTSSTEATTEEESAEANQDEDPKDQLSDAAKSFTESDKLASESNLDEAAILLREGTQQAFAAQKTFEDDVVKQEEEALNHEEEQSSEEDQEPDSSETVEDSPDSDTEAPSDTETSEETTEESDEENNTET